MSEPTSLEKVHKNNVRSSPPFKSAKISLCANTTITGRSIGPRQLDCCWYQYTEDVEVEEVVNDVHETRAIRSTGSIEVTGWKVVVCYIEGGLEVISKLVKNVRDSCNVGSEV